MGFKKRLKEGQNNKYIKNKCQKIKKSVGKVKSSRFNLKSDLSSSQFRWVNEKLYTSDSKTSKSMFGNDTSLFEIYHKGYCEQVKQWPINPVEHIIELLQKKFIL